jgi:hypothetical protein
MASIKKIAEGIKNAVKLQFDNLPENEVNEIVRRRLICAECPLMSDNAKEAGWYASIIPFQHCTACKCDISLKTACLSCNCGAEKIKEEPKWKAYEK